MMHPIGQKFWTNSYSTVDNLKCFLGLCLYKRSPKLLCSDVYVLQNCCSNSLNNVYDLLPNLLRPKVFSWFLKSEINYTKFMTKGLSNEDEREWKRFEIPKQSGSKSLQLKVQKYSKYGILKMMWKCQEPNLVDFGMSNLLEHCHTYTIPSMTL